MKTFFIGVGLVVGLVAALALGVGCDSNSGGNVSAGNNADESWADVHPPASIDIIACTAIVENADSTSLDECSNCCTTNGYQVSSFINQDHCTCANATPSDTTTCAAQTADSSACFNCCWAASYQMSGWIGGDTPSCTCDAKTDAIVCMNTLTRSNSADQCALCCLNHGYIGDAYISIGASECSCIAP